MQESRYFGWTEEESVKIEEKNNIIEMYLRCSVFTRWFCLLNVNKNNARWSLFFLSVNKLFNFDYIFLHWVEFFGIPNLGLKKLGKESICLPLLVYICTLQHKCLQIYNFSHFYLAPHPLFTPTLPRLKVLEGRKSQARKN